MMIWRILRLPKTLSFNNDNSYAENKESNKEPQFYDFSCVNSRHVHKNKKGYIFLHNN